MQYIGIDPGVSGAVAVIKPDNSVSLHEIPVLSIITGKRKNKKGERVDKIKNEINSYMLANLLYNIVSDADSHIAIEKVHGMPSMGVPAITSFMEAYGIIKGIVSSLSTLSTKAKVQMTLIPPQTWKKEMMAGMGKEKDASIQRALQLYPELTEELSTKESHNKAEALLIAHYLRSMKV